MRSISAEKELNKEERFNIFTPITAVWKMIKEMVDSGEIEDDREYTKGDYASMSKNANIDEKQAEKIAAELSKPIQAEQILAGAKKERKSIVPKQGQQSSKVQVKQQNKEKQEVVQEVEDKEIEL